ncbi:hypothetical protein LUZ60_000340 [Juncus effusus]|nr:hypothetical protein LUZ60_000340 [Juncus effusus]
MPRLTPTLSILLLILLFHFSSGQAVIADGNRADNPATKLGGKKSRKVLMEVQDYDYGQSNCRHDPRYRRPNCPHFP